MGSIARLLFANSIRIPYDIRTCHYPSTNGTNDTVSAYRPPATRLLHSARMTALYPDALPITDKIQTPIKLETFVSATATIGNSTLLPGIRAGIMKKHGGYLSVHTDFGNWTRNQTGICDANGYLPTEVILHTIQETHHQENCWLQLVQYTVYISYGIFTKESAMVSDEFIGNALQENGYAILPAPMKDV